MIKAFQLSLLIAEWLWVSFFSFLLILVFKLRVHLENRYSSTWATPLVHFALFILEMWYHELFAQADFNLRCSASQVAKITAMSHWCQEQFSFSVFKYVIYCNWHKIIHIYGIWCVFFNKCIYCVILTLE
jgi:hypothetical protein